MTIGEYIQEKFSLWSVELSEALINIEVARIGLSSFETMSETTNLDAFFYNVIPDIINMPSSISEGGYSVTYDKDALLKYYSMVARKLGEPDLFSENTITDITARWG